MENTLQSLLIVLGLLWFPGCTQPLADIAPDEITRVEIKHPNGQVVIADLSPISKLVHAMQNAKADSTAYDTAEAVP